MKDLFIRHDRSDYCINCHTSNIELYDMYNNPVNYSLLVTKYLQGGDINSVLNKRELSYFRCKKCGQIYRIDWRNNYFPIPYIYLTYNYGQGDR